MKKNITLSILALACSVNVSAQLITATGSMASKRTAHGSATLANGKILVLAFPLF